VISLNVNFLIPSAQDVHSIISRLLSNAVIKNVKAKKTKIVKLTLGILLGCDEYFSNKNVKEVKSPNVITKLSLANR
jgi:hypothetical protein